MWWSSALTSVPDAWPAPGCTTIPAGLLSTAMSGVLIQDVERERLGRHVRRLRLGNVDLDAIAFADDACSP